MKTLQNKGAYLIKIELKKDSKIKIGKLGIIFFKKGFYYYAGSAQNNLDKRIKRHYLKTKKMHWHIDFLTAHPNSQAISAKKYYSSKKEKECEIAKKFSKKHEKIKGFGCSDCKCETHLFYEKE
ncbi:MAG: GIY-YIG nuclease family protein [Candidatus Nanoarchaeia archaeon]|nr:GIY-YIG nuclease family protein [Candidatus Nanoarchaeia archaeon]MDD5053825.1 GIY-YIG nuclease family protein [Candidatus Nanoarchaeia archaeon]MDD5499512.1 GIY-YIG nuclease family protein [Candidatus Nanoarchaeia archaeon]